MFSFPYAVSREPGAHVSRVQNSHDCEIVMNAPATETSQELSYWTESNPLNAKEIMCYGIHKFDIHCTQYMPLFKAFKN